MKKYVYIGDEPKKLYDCTGKMVRVEYGDSFEMKRKPLCDSIEDYEVRKKKRTRKLLKNDGSE